MGLLLALLIGGSVGALVACLLDKLLPCSEPAPSVDEMLMPHTPPSDWP